MEFDLFFMIGCRGGYLSHAKNFTPVTGLADVFAAIKQAVKGQYGPGSTQYAQVKTMRW